MTHMCFGLIKQVMFKSPNNKNGGFYKYVEKKGMCL